MKSPALFHVGLGLYLFAAAALAEQPRFPLDPAHQPPTSVYARQRELVRRAAELRKQTREALQREARSQGMEELIATEDLIDAYIALRLDESLTAPERARLAAKVRNRLLRVHDRLEKALEPTEDANSPPKEAIARISERTAHRVAGSIGLASQLVLAQQGVAGPAGAAMGTMFGAAQPLPGDYGNELADLIQTVVAPSTWERNGGPGSIYYYRPLQVLVIRQSGEVHGRIGGAIEDLRRAGN